MASKSTNLYNRQNWEDSEFPIVCETCLGPDSYLRMSTEKYGKECKICQRPFTVFRWCPGRGARFKKTEICQTCSKLKNVCQTCILDLEFGLPVQVRDKFLRQHQQQLQLGGGSGGGGGPLAIPQSDVNREYFHQQLEKRLADPGTDSTAPYGGHALLGKMCSPAQINQLSRLTRSTPYYKRNAPHICTFWVKGGCKRGEECPYRHEKPTDPDDPLSEQNIKDRFYGVDDPVAEKMLDKCGGDGTAGGAANTRVNPPEDRSITTLYIGNVTPNKTTTTLDERGIEAKLRNYFYQFGEIRSVSVYTRQKCAFVQFVNRSAAERAVERCAGGAGGGLVLEEGGPRLTVNWGKSQAQLDAEKEDMMRQRAAAFSTSSCSSSAAPPPPPFSVAPPPLPMSTSFYGQRFPPPPPPPPFAAPQFPHRAAFSVPLPQVVAAPPIEKPPPLHSTQSSALSVVSSSCSGGTSSSSTNITTKKSGGGEPEGHKSGQILYPSQDPNRLGAK